MKKTEGKGNDRLLVKFCVAGAAIVLMLILSGYLSSILRAKCAPPEGLEIWGKGSQAYDSLEEGGGQQVYSSEEQERAQQREEERRAALLDVSRSREELSGEEQGEQNEPETADEWQPDNTTATVEGAFGAIFEEIFAPLGDNYECRYTAKGNWYMILSPGVVVLEGERQERDTERTLVYDRESKNGKCWLIVYYEKILNADGSEYSTAIRNTYAVDKESGAVVPSGKQAWADTGTAEYQEAAGEV